jgi:hypothetical protein
MRHHAFGDNITVALFAELDQVVLVLRGALRCRLAPPEEFPRWQKRLDDAVDGLSLGLINLLVEVPQ